MSTPPRRYAHAEAFMLMRYLSDDGTEEEIVWNARDGVTPFVIRLRSGLTATHADWPSDSRTPEDYRRPDGMRYFTDLTPARARHLAARAYDTWAADPRWAAGLRSTYGANRDAAIAELAAQYLSQPGAPDLIDPDEPPPDDPGPGDVLGGPVYVAPAPPTSWQRLRWWATWRLTPRRGRLRGWTQIGATDDLDDDTGDDTPLGGHL
jgi:hypothetical protein